MKGAAGRIWERGLELAGATALASACAWAATQILAGYASAIGIFGATLLIWATIFWGTYAVLSFVAGDSMPLPSFVPQELAEEGPFEELLLIDVRVPAPCGEGTQSEAEVLELADILAQPAPDSRVVRLFEAGPMPTAGQLHERIERHLKGEAGAAAAPDASEALHQALADLRRSLR